MSAAPRSGCPRCGSPDTGGALAAGLCPACLITAALAEDDGPCPYRILAPMSEDEAGVTYLARGLSGRRGFVALKVHDRHGDVEAALSRYERWKPALERVQHASIAPLLEVGVTDEGFLYVASEFVAGWPLTAIRSHVTLDLEGRAVLARQLADAIAVVHGAGLAHLALDATKVKVSTANSPRATILGLGTRLIVDGAEPRMELDRLALDRLISDL